MIKSNKFNCLRNHTLLLDSPVDYLLSNLNHFIIDFNYYFVLDV